MHNVIAGMISGKYIEKQEIEILKKNHLLRKVFHEPFALVFFNNGALGVKFNVNT